MTARFFTTLLLAAIVWGAAPQAPWAAERPNPNQIFIVGSSTVFPFAATVVETFGRQTDFMAPHIEPTGSGGGIDMFCSGLGLRTPDIANSSRPIKASEIAKCAANGVTEIIEVQIGFDGIVLANAMTGPEADFTKQQIFLALAKTVPVDGELVPNPYERWSEIDPGLPDIPITVLGPPPTSGTRDAFVELVMEEACDSFPEIAALAETDERAYALACASLREDGRFVEAGESDNLIVTRLLNNPNSFGIFGYSFLEENENLRGHKIDGVDPAFENIADGSYPIARSLFFYTKAAHIGRVPGLKEYLAEFTSDRAIGDFGYLIDKGLIPLPEDRRRAQEDAALALTPMDTGAY